MTTVSKGLPRTADRRPFPGASAAAASPLAVAPVPREAATSVQRSIVPAGTAPHLLRSGKPVHGTRAAEVVIIGAGLSGLYAARLLAEKGVDTLVLEAQNRVGGRTLTVDLPGGGFVDHGGQWVSDGQVRLIGLAQELGVALFPTWHEGLTVDWSGGTRSTYKGLFPPGSADAEMQARRAVADLEKMAGAVPLDAPWQAPQAIEWDAQTLDSWLAASMTSPRARTTVKRGIEGVFASGPGETSLLGALFTLSSAQDLVRHFATKPHGPDQRFVGGAQQLSVKLAGALADRVVLGAWVSHLEHSAQGVRAIVDRVHPDGLGHQGPLRVSPSLLVRTGAVRRSDERRRCDQNHR